MDFWKIFYILTLTLAIVTPQEVNVPENDITPTAKPEISTENSSTIVTNASIEQQTTDNFNSTHDANTSPTEELVTDQTLVTDNDKNTNDLTEPPAEDAEDTLEEDRTTPKNSTNTTPNFIRNVVEGNTTDDALQSVLQTEKPDTCEGFTKLASQPIYSGQAVLKKCCPLGEAIFYDDKSRKQYCDTSDKAFSPTILDVTFYNDCIEDNTDKILELEIEVGNPCNMSFVYSKEDNDVLIIIQNGSLLVMDAYGKLNYDILDNYCIDVDYASGNISAIACISPIDAHIGRGQTILLAIFMMISIPCLISVSVFHFGIKRLRTTHGLCLGSLSSSLAVGFLLHAIVHLSEATKSKVGYAIQFFMLSYFFWLFMMCCNVVIVVWYYLPRYLRLTTRARYLHFALYSITTFATSLCIVLLTRSKGLSGMPSYFYQAWSESIQSSQRYFIPPVTTVLILCFILLIVAYFGFRKLDSIVEVRSYVWYQAVSKTGLDEPTLPTIDRAMLKETKQDAMCIAFLAVIIFTSWILEVVTFYSPGAEDYLAIMEIINGLQGVFILMIFVVIRNRREIIAKWWHDRGSFSINEVEMQEMKH